MDTVAFVPGAAPETMDRNSDASQSRAAPIPLARSVWLESVWRVLKETSLVTVALMRAGSISASMLRRSAVGACGTRALPGPFGHASVEPHWRAKRGVTWDFGGVAGALVLWNEAAWVFVQESAVMMMARRRSPLAVCASRNNDPGSIVVDGWALRTFLLILCWFYLLSNDHVFRPLNF